MTYDIVKRLDGNSNSTTNLVNKNNTLLVVKQGCEAYNKHADIFTSLGAIGFNTPHIFSANTSALEMEYIPGTSIAEYLATNSADKLYDFLTQALLTFKQYSYNYNFVYELDCKFNELDAANLQDLPFTLHELRSLIPNNMPRGICHGDFSLDNIIHYNNKFYLIDCSFKHLNSWWLDAAKLLQDLDHQWFLRNKTPNSSLAEVSRALKAKFPVMNDPALSAFMLLRVLPYCKNSRDQQFIINSLRTVWN